MELASRVALGVVDEARRRHRRRWSAIIIIIIIIAVAVLSGGIGFELDRGGGGLTSASVGARPEHGAAPALHPVGACLALPGGRILLPLCVRRAGPLLGGPGGILPQNLVIHPHPSIANAPVRSR